GRVSRSRARSGRSREKLYHSKPLAYARGLVAVARKRPGFNFRTIAVSEQTAAKARQKAKGLPCRHSPASRASAYPLRFLPFDFCPLSTRPVAWLPAPPRERIDREAALPFSG